MARTNLHKNEERRVIAETLAALELNQKVEINDSPKRYFSLDIVSRPNKNAVIVPKFAQHISFFIEDKSLVKKLEDAEFKVEAIPEDPKRLFNRDKHRVSPLTTDDIARHKGLITEVLNIRLP